MSSPPDFPTQTAALDPAAALPGSATLYEAAAAQRSSRAALLAVEMEGSTGALLERDLRLTLQDSEDRSLTLSDFCRRDIVCPDQGSAAAKLAEDPELAAVLSSPVEGQAQVVQRCPPPVRTAVLMAGGRGERLWPLTKSTPKPLLEVAGRSLLFRSLDSLAAHGVQRVFLSIHYLGEQVRSAVGDGSEWGVEVTYLEETEPLDTGAGLSMLTDFAEPFYMVNGDILTNLDYVSLSRQHQLRRSLATVATYLFPAPLPYGLVHHDGAQIRTIEEKPIFRYPVNAGVYLFSPEVLDLVAHGQPLAMVDFLNEQAARGERIDRFPLIEYWNDVGSPADFQRAQEEAAQL